MRERLRQLQVRARSSSRWVSLGSCPAPADGPWAVSLLPDWTPPPTWLQELRQDLQSQQPELERISSLGEEILSACHPDAVVAIRSSVALAKSRFQEVSRVRAGQAPAVGGGGNRPQDLWAHWQAVPSLILPKRGEPRAVREGLSLGIPGRCREQSPGLTQHHLWYPALTGAELGSAAQRSAPGPVGLPGSRAGGGGTARGLDWGCRGGLGHPEPGTLSGGLRAAGGAGLSACGNWLSSGQGRGQGGLMPLLWFRCWPAIPGVCLGGLTGHCGNSRLVPWRKGRVRYEAPPHHSLPCQIFMEELSRKQADVEKITKDFKPQPPALGVAPTCHRRPSRE